MLHEGRLSVPRHLLRRAKYQLQEVDGRVYHLYPAAPAVLNVPLVAVCEWLGVSVYDEDGEFDHGAEIFVLRVGAALVTAATVALLFLMARWFLSRGWALTLTLVFAFGTPLFSTASRPYWNHTWAVFFLSLGLYCLLAPQTRRRLLRDACGATALSWAFFCRPTLAISVLAATALVVATRRRRLLPLALVGGGWAALYVGFSVVVFGKPLPTYFNTPQASSGRLEVERLLGFHLEGALGSLFSPARGLFFFTPILLLILLVLAWAWRVLDRPRRRLALAGLAVLVAHWHTVSSFDFWWGGASFGPRYFTDVLPWFLLLGAVATAATRARAAAGARVAARSWAAAALLLAAASLFVHSRGANNRLMVRHWGLWNWRYPPFMMGLVPYPGTPVPGAELAYSANLDRRPRDGWANVGRRDGFDLAMAGGLGYRRLESAGGTRRGAFVFNGTGGGGTRSLQELGGQPNRTEKDATFEIWLRPGIGGARRQVLFETGGRSRGLTIFVEAARPGVGLRGGEPRLTAEVLSPEALSRGELSQVAVLLRTTEAGLELSVHVNARRVAGRRLVAGVSDWAGGDASGLATAAHRPSLPAGEFHGEISLLRFYPAVLDDGQLRRNLRASTGGPRQGSRFREAKPLP